MKTIHATQHKKSHNSGGQARQLSSVAPQLQTTGGYPQWPVQASGFLWPLRIPAAPLCVIPDSCLFERNRLNVVKEVDTG